MYYYEQNLPIWQQSVFFCKEKIKLERERERERARVERYGDIQQSVNAGFGWLALEKICEKNYHYFPSSKKFLHKLDLKTTNRVEAERSCGQLE